MGRHAHGGTEGPWHNQGLSSIGSPNPTAYGCLWNGDGVVGYHWACIQILGAYDVGQHNSQVAPPSMDNAIGLEDPPIIGEEKEGICPFHFFSYPCEKFNKIYYKRSCFPKFKA